MPHPATITTFALSLPCGFLLGRFGFGFFRSGSRFPIRPAAALPPRRLPTGLKAFAVTTVPTTTFTAPDGHLPPAD